MPVTADKARFRKPQYDHLDSILLNPKEGRHWTRATVMLFASAAMATSVSLA
jgi:hypothetical protein